MKKPFMVIALSIFLLCVLLAVGCSSPNTTPTPATTTPPKTNILSPVTTTISAPIPSTTVPVTSAAGPATIAPPATKPASETTSSHLGGTLTWIEPNGPAGPIGASFLFASGNVCQQVCMETLLKEGNDGKLTEQLASLEYQNNPPTIIWHVKKGVKFSDGTEVNAQALKWNMQQQINSKLYASVSYYKSLDVIDDYTLSVPMTMQRNSIFPAFAKYQNYMVSPTAYEKNGIDWVKEHIVGTGAYVQSDWQRDVSFFAKRNPNYWNTGKPNLDSIKFVFVKDPMTQKALFTSSSNDPIILNATSNPLNAFQLAVQGYQVISQPADSMSLMPDSANADSPYSKIQVRQAVEYAIDKEGIAKTFGLGFWKAATQPASPEAPAYVPTITGRKYDVAKAKALLAEAGYADGFNTRIIALDTMDRNVLQAVQANLAAVKISTEIEFITTAKQADYLAKGWKNALLMNMTPFEGSILATIGYNFPPGRTSRYTVVKDAPDWKAVYDEIGTGPIVPEKASMQKASQVIYDDCTFIPIYWESSLWVVSDKVHDTGLGTRAPASSASPAFWDVENIWVSK